MNVLHHFRAYTAVYHQYDRPSPGTGLTLWLMSDVTRARLLDSLSIDSSPAPRIVLCRTQFNPYTTPRCSIYSRR